MSGRIMNGQMRTFPADLKGVLDHMPEAAVLVVDGVDWDEYERLLEDFAERPGLRFTYDRGRLEIVTTSSVHEYWKDSGFKAAVDESSVARLNGVAVTTTL